MCGIVGIVHLGTRGDAPKRVRLMADVLAHRGPDDDGFWANADVAFGFRRLAIVDLTTGAQPMTNEDGTVHVIFNGEIYNHRELRRELEARGHVFHTNHSDTETLVHGYEEWGTAMVDRLNGMFAFAVWDAPRRRLFLARDRLGIKPLYIAECGHELIFASEIRALHASGLVERRADSAGIFEYFQQQNVWGRRSMFAGVRMLEPGSFLELTPQGRREERFWDIRFSRRQKSLKDAAENLRAAVGAALKRQVAADVPIMTYLSGGIDSSAITARTHQEDPTVRAYSCLFDLEGVGDDRNVDEREFSRAVARELGIEQVELVLPQDDLERSLRPTIVALEEPRMGMAYVNYRIAQRVARDSKVVLSGCGGDEIVGGYVARYAYVRDQMRPPPQRTVLGRVADQLLGRWGAAPDVRQPLLTLYGFPVREAEIATAFTRSFLAAAGDYRMRDSVEMLLSTCPSSDPWDRLMYIDAKTYLHGLLVIEDKLSMAHSLETRVPLLDNEVIDAALTCPWSTLTDGTTGKIAFREAIRDWVPALVADKPKMGFGPPDASWYRGRLQPFVRRMLAPERIVARGIFEPAFVARAIEEHMSSAANRLPLIWSLLSFEAWCESFDLFGGDLGVPSGLSATCTL
jgi:asparagine synthase (glutamine-hydrolysing)